MAKAALVPSLFPSPRHRQRHRDATTLFPHVQLPAAWCVRKRKAEDVAVSVAFNPSGNFDISAFGSEDGTC